MTIKLTGTKFRLSGDFTLGPDSIIEIADDVIAAGTYSQFGAGAVSRPVQDRLREQISVADFGAVGDGNTDDSDAFAAAIVAAGPEKEVYVPAGTYIVKNVELLNKSRIRGQGWGLTTLKLKPGLSSSDYLTDRTNHAFLGFTVLYNSYPSGGYNSNEYLDSIYIGHLTIDGNAANQTSSEYGWGIYLNGVTRAVIENVQITNCLTHGWTLKESLYGTLRNTKSSGNGAGTNSGDAGVLISRSSYNLVENAESDSDGYGYEDEGRSGSYNPINRNSYNRWINITVRNAPNNGWDAVFADHVTVENLTVIGGAGTSNAAQLQLIGCSDVSIRNLRLYGSQKDGIRIWPETFGANGVSKRVRIWEACIYSAVNRPVHLEGADDVELEARIRGTTAAYAVALTAFGYGRTGGAVGTDPDTAVADHASGGYGMGDYAVGKAYLAAGQESSVWSGVGDYVRSDGGVWRLSAPFTGTKVSVTAPTGAGPTASDNGGTWTRMNDIGSSNVVLKIDHDATQPAAWASGQTYAVGTVVRNANLVYVLETAGGGTTANAPVNATFTSPIYSGADGYVWRLLWSAYQPNHCVYAFNPTNLTIRDSRIVGMPDHNIWVDGTSGGASGLRVHDTRSTGSGGRGLNISSGVLASENSFVMNSDFTGNTSAMNLPTFEPQVHLWNCAGGGNPRVGYRSAAPTSGTWAVGDVIWNSAPSAGGAPGWVCTTAGTPGTWKALASIEA